MFPNFFCREVMFGLSSSKTGFSRYILPDDEGKSVTLHGGSSLPTSLTYLRAVSDYGDVFENDIDDLTSEDSESKFLDFLFDFLCLIFCIIQSFHDESSRYAFIKKIFFVQRPGDNGQLYFFPHEYMELGHFCFPVLPVAKSTVQNWQLSIQQAKFAS